MRKTEERWALDRFLALRGEPTPDAFEANEEPDFVLAFGSRRVGVEVTLLHRNRLPAARPRQQQESLRGRVIRLAERLYTDRCLPAVHVSVDFNDQYTLSKATVTPLAEQMVAWAAAHVPQIGESFQEEFDWVNRHYFPEELHALRIYRYDGIPRPRFSAPDADYVPDLAVSDVLRALDSKNPRYHAYLRKCSEVWLVVSVNAGPLSTTFEVDDAVTETTYESPFDRIFLLQHMPELLCKLKRVYGARPDA